MIDAVIQLATSQIYSGLPKMSLLIRLFAASINKSRSKVTAQQIAGEKW